MLQACYQNEKIEAGVDEAGRGCYAGPVFAAAVILPPGFHHQELNDSKQVKECRRYMLREVIEAHALAWAVASASEAEIDQFNILQASFLAMHRAIAQLRTEPGWLLIDGNRFKPYKTLPYSCIVQGDGKYRSIAAASILAKTYRDDYMRSLHQQYPQYGWDLNKGYGTQAHREAIERYGLCEYHRRSFRISPAG